MKLVSLNLSNFRNYENAFVELSPGVNFIFGENAQGKTNLLESIYFLGLGKSFKTNKDKELVKIGKDQFQITGYFRSEKDVHHRVSILYAQNRKSISFDHKRLNRHSDLIGHAPMVLFSPEDHRITSGSPSERRKFLDVLLSQTSKHYLSNLLEYTNILKQRNLLLSMLADGRGDADELSAWDFAISGVGFEIIKHRVKFIEDMQDMLQLNYDEISNIRNTLKVEYVTSHEETRKDRHGYLDALKEQRKQELIRQTTLIGPHRDDIEFSLDQKTVREHGSRGEQKSVLLALKIVEHSYLMKKTNSVPILLLDDINSELDTSRQQNVFDKVQRLGQTLITSTSLSYPTNSEDYSFHLRDGNIVLH